MTYVLISHTALGYHFPPLLISQYALELPLRSLLTIPREEPLVQLSHTAPGTTLPTIPRWRGELFPFLSHNVLLEPRSPTSPTLPRAGRERLFAGHCVDYGSRPARGRVGEVVPQCPQGTVGGLDAEELRPPQCPARGETTPPPFANKRSRPAPRPFGTASPTMPRARRPPCSRFPLCPARQQHCGGRRARAWRCGCWARPRCGLTS